MKHYATAIPGSPDACGHPRIMPCRTSYPNDTAYLGRGGTGEAAQRAKAAVLWRKLKAGRLNEGSMKAIMRDNRRFFAEFEKGNL